MVFWRMHQTHLLFYISDTISSCFLGRNRLLMGKFRSSEGTLSCMSQRWILSFCWTAGLMAGICLYCSAADLLVPLIGAIPRADVSVMLLYMDLLMILLSAAAVWCSNWGLLFSLCFGKAFLLGFVSVGFLYCFGHGGWLMRKLFLFGEWLTAPILYCYWLRCLRQNGSRRYYVVLAVTLLFSFTARYADFCIISPIAAFLIDY